MSSVFPRNLITNEWLDPEHVAIEAPHPPKYVCSVLACFPSGRIITLRASADKGQQKSSVSHCLIHNVRQHKENASATFIWRELMSSHHEIRHFSSWAQTRSSVDLRICYIGFPELLKKSSLVCLVYALAISLQTNERILSTSRLKAIIRPNSFAST